MEPSAACQCATGDRGPGASVGVELGLHEEDDATLIRAIPKRAGSRVHCAPLAAVLLLLAPSLNVQFSSIHPANATTSAAEGAVTRATQVLALQNGDPRCTSSVGSSCAGHHRETRKLSSPPR